MERAGAAGWAAAVATAMAEATRLTGQSHRIGRLHRHDHSTVGTHRNRMTSCEMQVPPHWFFLRSMNCPRLPTIHGNVVQPCGKSLYKSVTRHTPSAQQLQNTSNRLDWGSSLRLQEACSCVLRKALPMPRTPSFPTRRSRNFLPPHGPAVEAESRPSKLAGLKLQNQPLHNTAGFQENRCTCLGHCAQCHRA